MKGIAARECETGDEAPGLSRVAVAVATHQEIDRRALLALRGIAASACKIQICHGCNKQKWLRRRLLDMLSCIFDPVDYELTIQ